MDRVAPGINGIVIAAIKKSAVSTAWGMSDRRTPRTVSPSKRTAIHKDAPKTPRLTHPVDSGIPERSCFILRSDNPGRARPACPIGSTFAVDLRWHAGRFLTPILACRPIAHCAHLQRDRIARDTSPIWGQIVVMKQYKYLKSNQQILSITPIP